MHVHVLVAVFVRQNKRWCNNQLSIYVVAAIRLKQVDLMRLPSMISQTLFCVHHYLLIVVGLVGAQGFRLLWGIIKACPLIPYSMYSCYLTILNF